VADDEDLEQEQEQSSGGGLRRQLEAALRDKKAAEEALKAQLAEAEQRGAQQAERRFQVQETFQTLGSTKKVADLWLKEHPDAEFSEDSAAAFLSDLGIERQQRQTEEANEQVREAVQAFQQPTPAASVSSGFIERAEFDSMMRDPNRRNEALRAAAEGRVKLNNPRTAEVQFEDTAGLFKRRD
jgi:hypothetical protein